MDDDLILYAALERGERDALGTLYDRHAAIVFAVALHLVGDRARAEDVVHDVFLDLARAARAHAPIRNVLRHLVLRVFAHDLGRGGGFGGRSRSR
ncbi:MAG TPA: sigma factor [Kofleriaceae bacterium]|nr:sigma factor [Kofleriaceae bacterium]